MMRISRRSVRKDRRGVAAIEFALVAPTLLMLTWGAIEVGLLVPWVKGGLQSVAGIAARCGAVGSPDCANVKAYAVGLAGSWVIPGVISTMDVTTESAAKTCNGMAGKFYVVTIACPYFASGILPPPLGSQTITVSACYPMA